MSEDAPEVSADEPLLVQLQNKLSDQVIAHTQLRGQVEEATNRLHQIEGKIEMLQALIQEEQQKAAPIDLPVTDDN